MGEFKLSVSGGVGRYIIFMCHDIVGQFPASEHGLTFPVASRLVDVLDANVRSVLLIMLVCANFHLSVELCSTGMRVCFAQLPNYDPFKQKHVKFLNCLSEHSIYTCSFLHTSKWRAILFCQPG